MYVDRETGHGDTVTYQITALSVAKLICANIIVFVSLFVEVISLMISCHFQGTFWHVLNS